MALLSQMFRNAAITGSTDHLDAWFADRQGKRWAEQTVRDSFVPHPHRRTKAEARDELTELRDGGVVSQPEYERLRANLGL